MIETKTLLLFLATWYYGEPHFNTVVVPDIEAESCEAIGNEFIKKHVIQTGGDHLAKTRSYYVCLPTSLQKS